MFASHSQKILSSNTGKKFHRYVRHVTSAGTLLTFIKLMKIDRLLIGELGPLTTDLIISGNEQTETVNRVVHAITQDQENGNKIFAQLTEVLNGHHLYATVFISEDQTRAGNTLVLALGKADNKVTYLSVHEDTLLNSAQKIEEV